ncbi:GNAT family N-acetyltransferase [Pantoea sp. FN060301]|uniref:GNAT family N-acetyltransferase n=1 Tax=Pantoea sp. FN060301 TaxID=3420380 RepID=UPI003D17970B
MVSFGIGVDPAFAGKGVGSALMKFGLTYSFDWLAVRKIDLEVFHDNEIAIGLYKKFGFREEG